MSVSDRNTKVRLIRRYEEVIVNNLVPTDILPHMMKIKTVKGVANDIRSCENSSASKASRLLIEKLVQSDSPDWYDAFIDALKDKGYTLIVRSLEGYQDVKNIVFFHDILNCHYPLFCRSVNAVDLLPHLLQKECLSEEDVQQIRAEDTSKGRYKATLMLLDLVVRKSVDWFPALIYALHDNNHDDLIKNIDAELVEAANLGYDQLKQVTHRIHEKKLAESEVREESLSFTVTELDRDLESINIAEPSDDVTDLELRPYQRELAEPGILGQNALIDSPPGTGKTHVAMSIIKDHLDMKPENGKVAFFVPFVCLVRQQERMCQKYLSQYSSQGVRGAEVSEDRVYLKDVARETQIIIMTPQILVDALKKKRIDSIGLFSLFIFDECHHTQKGHPYNQIMNFYMKEKYDGDRKILPQVIGLTATVGTGNAKDVIKAKDHILTLCANLDSPIKRVKKEIENLEEYVNKPYEELIEIEGRSEDPFYDEVSALMKMIEHKMQHAPEVYSIMSELRWPNLRGVLTPKSQFRHDSEDYKVWLGQLDTVISKIPSKSRRLFVTCVHYLQIYNNALIINSDCRSKDAAEFIWKNFHEIYEQDEEQKDETDRELLKNHEERQHILQQLSEDAKYNNPKLEGLKMKILSNLRRKGSSRGIVICRTRELAQALLSWANDDNEMSKEEEVNAACLTGARASAEQGGTTPDSQDKILQQFKNGERRLLFATSIGQEGIDIESCNFVITYEYVTNEIARIQAKGRGRDRDSTFTSIGDYKRGNTRREIMVKEREQLMIKAVEQIERLSLQSFQYTIEQKQKDAKKKLEEKERERQRAMAKDLCNPTMKVYCKKCNRIICFAKDLRMIACHHVVLDANIWDKIKLGDCKKVIMMEGGLKKTHKVYCNDCGQDLGIGSLCEGIKMVILKKGKGKTTIVFKDDSWKESRPVNKWEDLPFRVEEIDLEDDGITDTDFLAYKAKMENKNDPEGAVAPLSGTTISLEAGNLSPITHTAVNVDGNKSKFALLADNKLSESQTHDIWQKLAPNVCSIQARISNREAPHFIATGFVVGSLTNTKSNQNHFFILTAYHANMKHFFDNKQRCTTIFSSKDISDIEVDIIPKIIVGDKDLDYALLLLGSSEALYQYLSDAYTLGCLIAMQPPEYRDPLVLIGHPSGSEKKLDPGCFCESKEGVKQLDRIKVAQQRNTLINGHALNDHNFFIYHCSSYNGSSGCPVFSVPKQQLYGLHCGGIFPDKNDITPGRSNIVEYGVHIYEVVKHIETEAKLGKVPQLQNIERLHQLFPALKPQETEMDFSF